MNNETLEEVLKLILLFSTINNCSNLYLEVGFAMLVKNCVSSLCSETSAPSESTLKDMQDNAFVANVTSGPCAPMN